MKDFDVIILGGGAAGLMCAIAAGQLFCDGTSKDILAALMWAWASAQAAGRGVWVTGCETDSPASTHTAH